MQRTRGFSPGGITITLSHARAALATCLLVLLAGAAPAASLEAEPDVAAPSVRQTYTDVAAAVGLGDFLHAGFLGNATTDPTFVELMGPGMCWLDADTDGRLDLFLVNGRYYTDTQKEETLRPRSHFYRNLGGGTFEDATDATGLGLRAWGQGCAAADYDNDGDTDLYVAGYGLDALFRNDGGTFTNVTSSLLTVPGCGSYPCWNAGGTWFDADRDGCMDLYVVRFGNYTLGSGVQNGPEWAPQQRNVFYRGACGGAFTDATSAVGLTTWGNSWSAAAYDVNGDGWSDLYVANDGDENELWSNDGDGTFTLTDHADNDARAGMGSAIGDLDLDGRPDIGTTNYMFEDNGIFLQRADGTFEDVGGTSPFTQGRGYVGWALSFHDVDHDGRPDVTTVNGMSENAEPAVETEEPVHVYRQRAEGGFEQWNRTLGGALSTDYVARGAAWADHDDDGDLDMALAEAGESRAHLLRSDHPVGHFLTLSLVGNATGVTRDAEGAKVTVSATGIPTLSKEKRTQQGIHSSNDPRVHFGLGQAREANVTIRWPDGSVQSFGPVRANTFVRVVQGGPLEVLREMPLATASGPDLVQRTTEDTFTASLDREVAWAGWDFGDGTWAVCEAGTCRDQDDRIVGSFSGSTVTLLHAFASVGPYDIRVALRDTLGNQVAKQLVGRVFADIIGTLVFDSDRFDVGEPARGTAAVRYATSAPVAGADVRLELNYSFWPQVEQEALPFVPAGVRTVAGYRTMTLEGVTGADGTWRFEVPLWWQSPIPAASAVAFNPVGDYHASLSGSFRLAVFEDVNASYRVVPQP